VLYCELLPWGKNGVKSSLLPFLSPSLGLEIGPVLDFHELVADGQNEEAPALRIVENAVVDGEAGEDSH